MSDDDALPPSRTAPTGGFIDGPRGDQCAPVATAPPPAEGAAAESCSKDVLATTGSSGGGGGGGSGGAAGGGRGGGGTVGTTGDGASLLRSLSRSVVESLGIIGRQEELETILAAIEVRAPRASRPRAAAADGAPCAMCLRQRLQRSAATALRSPRGRRPRRWWNGPAA
jgi:hypothetical protein